MSNIIAVIYILNPFIKVGATLLGVVCFGVYYYTMKDTDWREIDNETEE